ncbi:MAG: DUF3786 domain-containing protein [Clostridia bacterium]|nr:DUF3786 domain-containing protein [Clostridia bacterium]
MGKLSVHQEAKNLFLQRDPAEIAAITGGIYLPGERLLELKYLTFPCQVNTAGEVTVNDGKIYLSRNEITLILQYLTGSSGIQPRGQWVSFLQLPDGPHHHIPFKLEALDPLAETFGDDLPELEDRAVTLGGQKIPMGDLGFVFNVFPKLPMAVVVWKGDDEFPAKANILFDANAPLHLTTAQLWVLGVQLVARLTQEARVDYL